MTTQEKRVVPEDLTRYEEAVIASKTPCLTLATSILGRRATNVLDVGAREAGVESRWWMLAPLAGLFGFEADKDECDRLNAKRSDEKYFPVVLARQSGSATLHMTTDPACSSLYEPDSAITSRLPGAACATKVAELVVNTVTLDEWWTGQHKPDIGFIKLDTQGSELDILQGGPELLKRCVGCEVEVEFSPLYKGQPLFSEVDTFMRSQGFSLWRLYGLTHYPEFPSSPHMRVEEMWFAPGLRAQFRAGSGQLYWGNAIYFRVPEAPYYSEDPERLLILLALMEACREYDGVQAVLRRLMRDGILPRLSASLVNALTTPAPQPGDELPIETLQAQLRSAMRKAGKWDRFRRSVLGRLLGRAIS